MDIRVILNNGKNPKWKYYLKNIIVNAIPTFFFQHRLKHYLEIYKKRSDKDYILERVNYYNKLDKIIELSSSAPTIRENSTKNGKVYYFDTKEITRYLKSSLRWFFCFGDVIHVPKNPSIVKSRPIHGDNENSIILKLDKVRHFIFLKDKIEFSKKQNKAIFRGKMVGKPHRIAFMEKYFGNPMFDLGDVSKNTPNPNWIVPKITLQDHLKYKFIMAIEGNDVASNLKWVMSSNSIAVMPKPTYETWFMEGKLIPNFHYIEIKADYSDIEEKLNYYIQREEESLEIIKNANAYCSQFFDSKREKLISILVMKKYFEKTKQSIL